MEDALIVYIWFFIIYAFLGWGVEVSFHALTEGKFVNRGFLNGPVCPIYGFGMVIVLYFLSPLVDNFLLLFLGAVVLTSVLEYITGFVLEKVFNDKWWDYTNMPFNINGYISLSFSIMWGLAAVFVINIIQPFIFKFTSLLTNKVGNVLLVVFIIYFIADFIVTTLAISEINKRFYLLEEMAGRLKGYSDNLGEDIYNKINKVVDLPLDKEQKIKQIEEKYNKLKKKKSFVHRRLEKSYPNIKKRLARIEKDHKTR